MSQVISRQSPIKKKRPGPICLSCRYLNPRASEREKISWKAEKRVIVSALCAELSRKGLNSDSLPPLFGQGAGVPYGCGMGRPYGGNYGQAPG
jgi:hypothetical protein